MSSLEYWLDSIVSPHFPALTTDAKAMSSTAVSSVQTELFLRACVFNQVCVLDGQLGSIAQMSAVGVDGLHARTAVYPEALFPAGRCSPYISV